jgi:hypothetical protein
MQRERLRNIPDWIIALGVLALFAWHSHHSFLLADAGRNSLLEAQHLSQGAGFRQMLGKADPLWTLLLAGFAYIDVSPEKVALYGSIGLGAAGLALSLSLLRLLRVDGLLTWVPAMALAASPAFVQGIANGTGSALYLCLVALAWLLYVRADTEPRWSILLGLVLAACVISRPEGALLSAALAVHRLALALLRDRRWPPRPVVMGTMLFLSLCAAFVWICWQSSGQLWPPLYHVTLERSLDPGLGAIAAWAKTTGILYASPLLLLSLVCRRGTRQFVFVSVALLSALLFSGFAVVTRSPSVFLLLLWLSAVFLGLGLFRIISWLRRDPGHS